MIRQGYEKKVKNSSLDKIVSHKNQSIYAQSNSADKLQVMKKMQCFHQQQTINKIIQKLDNNIFSWKSHSFQQKRNISGFKSRFQWSYKDLSATLKFSFGSDFFQTTGQIVYGSIIVQLQQINFDLGINEKRDLQQQIQKMLHVHIDKLKTKGFTQQSKRHNQYLKTILNQLGNQFVKRTTNKKKTKQSKVQKNKIIKNFVPYPLPITFSWNPLGALCVNQNRYPHSKKSIIGQPLAFKKYFQSHRLDNQTKQQQTNLQIGPQQNKSSLFSWNIDQQISFLIFNRQKQQQDSQKFTSTKNRQRSEYVQKKQQQKQNQETHDLGTVSKYSHKLRLAYQRFFCSNDRGDKFNRYDKLKVYDVRSLNKSDQDDIVYLIQRINNKNQQQSVFEVVFYNFYSIYNGFLSCPLDKFRFQIVSKQLKNNIDNPNLSFSIYLKIFLLQNQYYSLQLLHYFKQHYEKLQIKPHPQLYHIGSYNHFDQVKAEIILMDLISKFLPKYITQSYSKIHTRLSIKIKQKININRFLFEGIVAQQQKNEFLMRLFPLLIVKDREMERFQFKKIKRIIAANAKMISFFTKMNEIIKKIQQNRFNYLNTLLQKYSNFKTQKHQQNIRPNNYFYYLCGTCKKLVHLHQLPKKQQIQICINCTFRKNSQYY